jgi:hypothetical protein
VIGDFERWISLGAVDPRTEDVAVPQPPRAIDIAAGRSHWAFQAVETRDAPQVRDAGWSRTWIDRFILAKLETAGIRPQADADRATLFRRLSFDLVGLPPSEADMQEVLADPGVDVIDRSIDRLLAAPQFGEHWGRHWLDVVRYADSNGGDYNATFHDAWRYRNYVIDAFNADRPFDVLIREQVAGDLLPAASDNESERQLVATGFLMLGTKMLTERDKEKLQMDVVDEQVSAIGACFLGMTLGCARCHDHKFDPIPTSDYYALAGILRSTKTLDGEFEKYVSKWGRRQVPMSPEAAAALAAHRERERELLQRIQQAQDRVRQTEAAGALSEVLEQGTVVDDTAAEIVGAWKESKFFKQYVGRGYIHDDRQDKGQKHVTFRATLPEPGEYEVRIAFPGTKGRATSVPVRIVHADGEKTVMLDQSREAQIHRLLEPLGRFRFTTSQPAEVTVSNEGTEDYVVVDAVQFVPVRDAGPKEADSDGMQAAALVAARADLDALKKQQKELEAAAPPSRLAFAVQEQSTVGDGHILVRGEIGKPGPKVRRGILQVATAGEPPNIPGDESGRRELAEWVADPQNPLTARVYVNRVWQHLLGSGIVRSVDNFGALGERPTHPELLDQLAVEFVSHGWSTKWLVRQIVGSRVYRLSSDTDVAASSVDPENRLLWRAHRKRISAESIRDAMLMAGGTLESRPVESTVAGLGKIVRQQDAQKALAAAGAGVRTVYLPILRSELTSLLRVFDFADPDYPTGERARTNVPAQALWMLNNDFVADCAGKVATRVLEHPESGNAELIARAYRLTLGRPPMDAEAAIAATFLTRSEAAASPPQVAWQDLVHAIFASTAFRTLD